MDVVVTPPPLPVLDQADPLFRAYVLWHQERLRVVEAERNELQSQLDAAVSPGPLSQAPLGEAQIPIEFRRLIAAQAQRIEALEAPLKQLEERSARSARKRTTTPILNLSLDVWEQTPPIVQQLLVGLYQQVRQMAAAPASDPILNLPLEVWEGANPLLQERLIELCEQVEALSQQVRLLRGQIFGSKSEKIPEGSFKKDGETPSPDAGGDQESPPSCEPTDKNSPAAQPAAQPAAPKAAGNAEGTKPAQAERRRGFRKPLPEELPRIIETHDIDDAEKQCGCGKAKSCIGAEDASRMEFVPAHLRVIVHRRPKWVCRACEGLDYTVPLSEPQRPAAPSAPGGGPDMIPGTEVPVVGEAGPSEASATSKPPATPSGPSAVRRPVVSIALAPKELIPKGIATASLLAHIVVSKFLDSLPLYRQQEQFARVGVRIPRSTMTRWLLTVYRACVPLLEVLHNEVLAARVVGADESEVQVLKEPNRSAASKSYMWTFRGGTQDKPAIQLVYAPTRSAQVAKDYLRGYQGGVQTDGYAGYDFLDALNEIVHLGCMAHARRKFVDVLKALSKDWKNNVRGVAGEAILTIRELYAIERQADSFQMTEAQRHELRHIKSKPLMDALHDTLLKAQGTVLPTSKLGEAIGYTLNQWSRLERYLEAGHYRIDNNLVENVFKLFAVGRRNWLFCYSQDGARASACFYSLILTAKANGLDPYCYLKALFQRLPYANPKCEDDYRALLPQNIDRTLLIPEQF